MTLLAGGPGLGKTTLLAQAMGENRLAPRGEDVWLGLEQHDRDADSLARALAAALAPDRSDDMVPSVRELTPPDVRAVAELVWQRSPSPVCIVLDDVHLLAPGTAGAAWLGAFLDALPANGHLLLSSRTEPAIPLARLDGAGAVRRLGEDDLRLTEGELAQMASQLGIGADRLATSGGWPAMAELAASTEQRRAGAYLWEEVLEPLGAERRRMLGIVSDLGGADDRLATAAAGTSTPVDLGAVLGDIPLVAEGIDGWFVPHALWRGAPGLGLDEPERAEVRRRAVRHLLSRDRIDQAFVLVQEAELWDTAPEVLRAACLQSERLSPGQLERFLAASPAPVRDSAAGRLAAALKLAFTQPSQALGALHTAADRCHGAGDVEGELTAIAQLGRLAWGRQDVGSIGGEVIDRIAEIEATGNSTARGLAGFIRALIADLAGDDDAVLAELGTIEPGVLDPVWEVLAVWFRGGVRLDRGEAEAVLAMIEGFTGRAGDPAVAAILGGLRARVWWALGRLDEALDQIPQLVVALRAAGVASIHAQGLVNASLALSYTGDVAGARECLAEGTAVAYVPEGTPTVRMALTTASLLLAEGDEDGARKIVDEALEVHGVPDRGPDRRVWRHVLSLSYLLVPETRAGWDAASLRGHQAFARDLAAALAAAREGRGRERLWRLDLTDINRVRSALHHRFAAELAVALTAIGRSEGQALLDAMGVPGRAAVDDLTRAQPRQAKPAKSLLAAVPAPPPVATYVTAFGPLAVARDDGAPGAQGERREVLDADLRRSRVRALLAYLVGHRKTHRAAITAALWPDLDDKPAGNNLGVTLNYLLHALEPWRTPGEPPYLVRLDGTTVELMVGHHLHVDVDEFVDHVTRAARAEDGGNASAALGHHLAAVELYRGDLFIDVAEAHWLDIERTHHRSRYVTSAIRASQLLVGCGDTARAEDLAQRALLADPWNEDAYAALASASLARGDRSAARSTLKRCFDALAELGAEPSYATRQLSRRSGVTRIPPEPAHS
ncbi:MAG TPA: BTAD domain-containing putative transcriptional regulator [Acidimicrobiales bacterium]|nr:BTAD domain-containing putative transcriptional regulator [Acidimicrobiales bacterium]